MNEQELFCFFFSSPGEHHPAVAVVARNDSCGAVKIDCKVDPVVENRNKGGDSPPPVLPKIEDNHVSAVFFSVFVGAGSFVDDLRGYDALSVI